MTICDLLSETFVSVLSGRAARHHEPRRRGMDVGLFRRSQPNKQACRSAVGSGSSAFARGGSGKSVFTRVIPFFQSGRWRRQVFLIHRSLQEREDQPDQNTKSRQSKLSTRCYPQPTVRKAFDRRNQKHRQGLREATPKRDARRRHSSTRSTFRSCTGDPGPRLDCRQKLLPRSSREESSLLNWEQRRRNP